jgi:hypothetical protein
MGTLATSDLNPYAEIWPLEHNAEIWGHRPKDFFKHNSLDEEGVMSEASRPEGNAMEPRERPDNPSIARPVGQYYDKDEILSALRDLSAGEIKQMQRFARFHLVGNSGRPCQIEVEDLFGDATIRTMEQKRRWKRGVGIFNHFFAVMRSIGHQRFKQASRYAPLNQFVAASQDLSLSTLDAQTNVDRLKAELRGDAIALNVLESMLDEMAPRETRQSLGISAGVYWAARKRIRRRAEDLPGAARLLPCIPPRRPSRDEIVARSASERMSTL